MEVFIRIWKFLAHSCVICYWKQANYQVLLKPTWETSTRLASIIMQCSLWCVYRIGFLKSLSHRRLKIHDNRLRWFQYLVRAYTISMQWLNINLKIVSHLCVVNSKSSGESIKNWLIECSWMPRYVCILHYSRLVCLRHSEWNNE